MASVLGEEAAGECCNKGVADGLPSTMAVSLILCPPSSAALIFPNDTRAAEGEFN